MPTSLFIEHHPNGLAFYINGDLQFDTTDEALYHEYLVIPALTLAIARFPNTHLRVLICGGGDGLAVREVLRFSQVNPIDLVDYNPEVLELGRTVFQPFNCNSLASDRLTIYTQEALAFVTTIPDQVYHLIICDFTYPTSPEDTSIYSQEWFQQVSRVLIPSGIMSTNGVSPENRTNGFWCLYQTLLSANLHTKPLQLNIPSFRRHGYGNWGFFLASPTSITRSEIESIELPDQLQALTHKSLLHAFIFREKIAQIRYQVNLHTLTYPQLFYYLLNPSLEHLPAEDTETFIDFLDIEESSNGLFATRDPLKLESMAEVWLEQLNQSQALPTNLADINKLLPVQHRYHSPKMTREWFTYLQHLLAEIDLLRLLNSLLERAQELPPQIAQELKQLAEKIRTGKPLPNLPPQAAQFVMMLSVTLLMANLVTPDAVFAKGYYSSGSSNCSGQEDYDCNNDDGPLLGLILITIGIGWLVKILQRSRDD